MSRPQDPHRPLFPFGNPLRMILPKGSYISPRVMELLNKFEETLSERFRKLRPKGEDEILGLSWMILAMQLLSETHNDIKSFITDLELPVCDWDQKWIDMYLDNSVKLLDICIAFCSELSRLSQGQLLLQCGLHKLDHRRTDEFLKAQSSFDNWRQHIASRNPRIENCCSIVDTLMESLNLPKVKNSAKGKVLMRAMYGVKVFTLFICSIFTTAFMGSDKKLTNLHVPEMHVWAVAFTDIQAFMNKEIRNLVSHKRNVILKELEDIEISVKELYPFIQDGVESRKFDAFQNSICVLGKRAERLSSRIDLLAKEVDGFFQIVLGGRDALLSNLRIGKNVSDSVPLHKTQEQIVK